MPLDNVRCGTEPNVRLGLLRGGAFSGVGEAAEERRGDLDEIPIQTNCDNDAGTPSLVYRTYVELVGIKML